jgi:hypothetical protein
VTTPAPDPHRPPARPPQAPAGNLPDRRPAPATPHHLQPRLKVCRLHPAGILLDLPFTAPPGSQVSAATFWPESTSPNGWAHRYWDRGPDRRGFVVPQVGDLGDVVGFAAFHHTPDGQPSAAWKHQTRMVKALEWWGYLHAVEDGALVLHGPHPHIGAAHAAAQHALLAHIHQGPGGGAPAGAGEFGAGTPREPAQPPAAPTVSWHGRTATVGDPRFGWLHVDAGGLAAALSLPPDRLAAVLADRVPGLDGTEPPVTLAALAALHTPDRLPDIHRPADPAHARHPTAPTGPAAPHDPADPTGPTTSHEPTGPADPAGSANPTDPTGPAAAPAPPGPDLTGP